MQYKKYVDIAMLDEDCWRVKREQNINYEDLERRVSCVPASEIIQEFYDASNAKDTLPMVAPEPTHEHPER